MSVCVRERVCVYLYAVWLFGRGFAGSLHCLFALFHVGEVHVVGIVRIQVRNSSRFFGTHAKRTKVRTMSFCQRIFLQLLLLILSRFLLPLTFCACFSTQCDALFARLALGSSFKHVYKELCSDSLLKCTR